MKGLLLFGALVAGFLAILLSWKGPQRTLARRIAGGSLFLLGLFWMLGLVSHALHQSPNWMGAVGHTLAFLTTRYLGWFLAFWGSLLTLVMGGLAATRPGERHLFLSGVLLYGGIWLALLLPFFPVPFDVGLLPRMLHSTLQEIFGPVGGVLILNLLLGVTLSVTWVVVRGVPGFRREEQTREPEEQFSTPPDLVRVLGENREPLPSREEEEDAGTSRERPEPPPDLEPDESPSPTPDTGTTSISPSPHRLKEVHTPLVYPKSEALVSLLSDPVPAEEVPREVYEEQARQLEEILEEFGISGKVVNFNPGPVVTRYEYAPAPGVKISRITQLADDLALRLKSSQIRVVAPLPNRGLVGIEVPSPKRRVVHLKELVDRPQFRKMASPLAFALGVDPAGFPMFGDLAGMPHLLIAGATGSGKSVAINTMITSILLRVGPDQVRFLLVDPKRVELSFYEGIPHLLMPVIKESEAAVESLQKAVKWMEFRYNLLARAGRRDIRSYNRWAQKTGERPMPYIVIVIDEFADIILTADRKEVEEPLARLAQMARAVGIHLVVATQRPSVDVITGTIKANFPVRIAFKVASRVDSRTILDQQGAEKLLGKGDMLFIPPGEAEPMRLHGPYISEEETRKVAHTLIEQYLRRHLLQRLPSFPDVDGFVQSILEDGHYIALIRDDEPGTEERVYHLVREIQEHTGVNTQKAMEVVREIRKHYYMPIPELEAAPLQHVRLRDLSEDETRVMVQQVVGFAESNRKRITEEEASDLLGVPAGLVRELFAEMRRVGILMPPRGKRGGGWRLRVKDHEAMERWEKRKSERRSF